MASVYKRTSASGSTVWYLSYKKHGKWTNEPLGEISQKEAYAKKQRKLLEEAKNTLGVMRAICFGEYMLEYLAWYKTQYPDSHERVESILRLQFKPLLETTPLNLITKPMVSTWRTARIEGKEPVARETVNKEIQTLKAMLECASGPESLFHYLEVNPLRKSGKKNVRDPLFFPKRGDEDVKFLEVEQLEDLYKRSSPRNAAIWKFMANTGLRAQEMAKLVLGDIYLSEKENSVRVVSYEADPTKTRKSRSVPLNQAAVAAYHKLVTFLPNPTRTTRLVKRMHEKSFLRLYVTDATRAHYHTGTSTPNPVPAPHLEGFDLPLPESSLKALRHSFGSHMAMAGVNLRALQKVMGHARIETTMIYAGVSRKHLAKSTDAVDL